MGIYNRRNSSKKEKHIYLFIVDYFRQTGHTLRSEIDFWMSYFNCGAHIVIKR
jgi:hypothetical protein